MKIVIFFEKTRLSKQNSLELKTSRVSNIPNKSLLDVILCSRDEPVHFPFNLQFVCSFQCLKGSLWTSWIIIVVVARV